MGAFPDGSAEFENEVDLELLEQINEARQSGDHERFLKLSKQMPLPAEVAMAYKKSFGTDFITNSGFNLSEAEKKYGSDWLSR